MAYWTTEWIADDSPTPGLREFVHRIKEAGGEVVFISGRWLPEHVEPTLATLKRAGISEPKLIIGNKLHPSLGLSGRSLSDDEVKVLQQEAIKTEYGLPVAVIDDRIKNRNAVIGFIGPTTLGVAICIPGFTYDPASDNQSLRISTFEMFD